MTVHFLPKSNLALQMFPAWKPFFSGGRETTLLVGFQSPDGSGAALSERLRGSSHDVQRVSDPYSALGMLLDDPGEYRACIFDARDFDDEEALWDVLRLMSFEQGDYSIIVVNLEHPERFAMTDRHRGTLHLALGDCSAPEAAQLVEETCRGAAPAPALV